MFKNPSLALLMIGVPQGDEDDPRTPSTCMEEVWKKFQMTNVIMSNNILSFKSVLGRVDIGVPHGNGDGPRTPPRCMEGGLEKVSND